VKRRYSLSEFSWPRFSSQNLLGRTGAPITILAAVPAIADSRHTNNAWPQCAALAEPVGLARMAIITIVRHSHL
jgi:hypothetical protein